MEVVDIRGDKVGKIDSLLLHGDGEEPHWALVKMGVLGMRDALMPLQDAEPEGEGELRIPYEKDHIRAAASIEREGDGLSDDGADVLHRHYGLEPVTGPAASGAEDDIELPRETRDAKPPGMEEGDDGPVTKRRRERARELGVPGHQ